jgi:hypothetical protein
MKPLMHVITMVAVVTVGGCASSNRSEPKVRAKGLVEGAQAVASPCVAAVSGTDLSSWQTVAGDGFTFCVPANWHGRAHNWHATGATMEWGTGKARGHPVKVTEVRVVSRAEIASGRRPDPSPMIENQQFTDQVDGHSVTLWRNRFNGKYYVGGQWDSPQVWLLGQSDDSPSADTQMVILRTVRFVTKTK